MMGLWFGKVFFFGGFDGLFSRRGAETQGVKGFFEGNRGDLDGCGLPEMGMGGCQERCEGT